MSDCRRCQLSVSSPAALTAVGCPSAWLIVTPKSDDCARDSFAVAVPDITCADRVPQRCAFAESDSEMCPASMLSWLMTLLSCVKPTRQHNEWLGGPVAMPVIPVTLQTCVAGVRPA